MMKRQTSLLSSLRRRYSNRATSLGAGEEESLAGIVFVWKNYIEVEVSFVQNWAKRRQLVVFAPL